MIPPLPSCRSVLLKGITILMTVLVGVLLIGFIVTALTPHPTRWPAARSARERVTAAEIVGTVRDCEVYRLVDHKVEQHVVYVLMCGALAGHGIAVAQ